MAVKQFSLGLGGYSAVSSSGSVSCGAESVTSGRNTPVSSGGERDR